MCGSNLKRAGQPRSNQIKPDQTRSNQVKPEQTRANQIKPDQSRSNQIKPDKTKSNKIKQYQKRSNHNKIKSNHVKYKFKHETILLTLKSSCEVAYPDICFLAWIWFSTWTGLSSSPNEILYVSLAFLLFSHKTLEKKLKLKHKRIIRD